jgi:hypothetical protein
MADLFFIGLLIGFFALSVGFVRACEWILGSDEPEHRDSVDADEQPTAEVAA